MKRIFNMLVLSFFVFLSMSHAQTDSLWRGISKADSEISLDYQDQLPGEDLHGWFVRHRLMKQVDLLERAKHGDDAAAKELNWWCYDHTPAYIRRFLMRPDDVLPDSINQQRLQQLGFMK